MIPSRRHSRRHRAVASATEVTEERHTGQWMLLTYFFLLRSKICFKKWCLKEAHRALKMFSAERIHHQSLTAGLLLFFLTIPEGMWVLPLASYCWDTVVMATHFWCLSHAWSHTWHSISPHGSFKSTYRERPVKATPPCKVSNSVTNVFGFCFVRVFQWCYR